MQVTSGQKHQLHQPTTVMVAPYVICYCLRCQIRIAKRCKVFPSNMIFHLGGQLGWRKVT